MLFDEQAAPDIPSRGATASAVAAAFVFTFAFRWVTASFPNDHFTHLTRARQIVMGEWPIRDFFDPGQFLHYYLSAAMQVVFGYGLFGEALLTTGFMALGAAITCGMASRLARSVGIGMGAAVLSVMSYPRLYNYPKVIIYPAAIWLAWRYAQRPSRGRLALLAVCSIVAFLFRYDHGAYVVAMIAVLLVLVHANRPRQWLTATVTYGALCAVLLTPFAIYVQWAEGVVRYIEDERAAARLVGDDMTGVPPVRLAQLAPSATSATSATSAPSAPSAPSATSTASTTSAPADASASAAVSASAAPPVSGSAVVAAPPSAGPGGQAASAPPAAPSSVATPAPPPAVPLTKEQKADVRRQQENSAASTVTVLWRRVSRLVPRFRPPSLGLSSQQNALWWFYYVVIFLPYVAAAVSVGAWWRGRIDRREAAAVLASAFICFVISRTLVRSNPNARLADVAAPMAVLGAWVAGRYLTVPPEGSLRAGGQTLRRIVFAVFSVVMLWSVGVQADITAVFRSAHLLEGPSAIRSEFTDVTSQLQLRPIDYWSPPDQRTGLRGLVRYVRRCTAPTDRLIVTGIFAPEAAFYAERAFGGGQVHFLGGWHNSLKDQGLTIERLRAESIPIVLDVQRGYMQRSFPHIQRYIEHYYHEVPLPALVAEDTITWHLLVANSRTPVSIDPVLGLPCYRDPPGDE